MYLSSLIKSERGFLYTLNDTVYGNKDKGREINHVFVKEIKKYPGLLEIMMGIEGLIDKRTRHAAGVVISENITDYCSIMRTPSREIISSYSLYPLEDAGLIKWDFLVTDACSKITTAINMLQKYNEISKNLSLKEAYYTYFSPDVIDRNNKKLWDRIDDNTVMDLFQFNTGVGLQAIQKIQPRNVVELAAANAVMRLQAEKGGENPLDRFHRLKNNIKEWYNEMRITYKLTEKEINILKPYYEPYYGCVCLQETLMELLMDKNICNFSLAEANKARKVVSKKQMTKIPELKEKVFNSIENKLFAQYVWDTGIKPQLGYSFSLPHCLGYGWVAMQEAYLTLKYPQIYWNTACLCVNAAAIEENEYPVNFLDNEDDDEKEKKKQGVNYDKIARALGETLKAGIKIAPPHINFAQKEFEPDVKNNQILYSLKSLIGVGDNEIAQIFENRPFNSLEDYLDRTNIKKPATISLIKSGAFDDLENQNRVDIMKQYISYISEPKKVLNLRNFNSLIERDMIPEELDYCRRVFNFNKYIRDKKFKINGYLYLDNIAETFLSINYPELYSEASLGVNGLPGISEKKWKKIYDKEMDKARNWMKEKQEELLNIYNDYSFREKWDKYCIGNISRWEMDSMCFYWHEHELENINFNKYGISHFSELDEEPIVDMIYTIKGRNIPIFKLSKIVGTCIGKNNMKNTFTLLTEDGEVVDIRLSNEHYAFYNKQISELNEEGVKKVKEKSWFTRGNKLMVVGYRRGNDFVPKKYKRTPVKHRLFLITEILDNHDILFTSARYGAEE